METVTCCTVCRVRSFCTEADRPLTPGENHDCFERDTDPAESKRQGRMWEAARRTNEAE